MITTNLKFKNVNGNISLETFSLKSEKRKLERKANSDERKREWSEKFGVDWSSSSRNATARKEVETAGDFQMNRGRFSCTLELRR